MEDAMRVMVGMGGRVKRQGIEVTDERGARQGRAMENKGSG